MSPGSTPLEPVIYSTFLSGSQADTIAFAAIAGTGIYFSGVLGSPDFPGLDGVPLPCMPETYATSMSLDGASITAARVVNGTVLAYNALTAKFLAWTGAQPDQL
jgi:hypothetical protein